MYDFVYKILQFKFNHVETLLSFHFVSFI